MAQDKISEFLDMDVDTDVHDEEENNISLPIVREFTPPTPVETIKDDKAILEDFNTARENIKDLADLGVVATKRYLEIAAQSQSARSFEVLAGLLKAATETNKDVIDIHQKAIKVIEDEGYSSQKPSTINAENVFLGTTTEFVNGISGKANRILEEKEIDGEVIENDKE